MEPAVRDIEVIYHAALEKDAGRERSAYLDTACGQNTGLRARVEALLRADQEAGAFLEMPPFDPDITLGACALAEGPGTVIGRRADMPRGRGVMSCSAVDGIIYAIGGTHTGGTGVDRAVPTVEAYDPTTDTWTAKAPMLTARCSFSTCVVNGTIYAIGGCSNAYDSSELSSVEAYDPATDTWTKMPDMQVRRKALASAAVNGKIYAIGGQPVAGWDAPLATVEEYDLSPLPPDFNGDGRVDGKDLLILAEYWGTDDPICDIAPWPFGDGPIDLQDVIVLAEYIGEEVNDPTLIAHWALDEAEGTVAHDNAGGNDGTLLGVPMWQPEFGKVGGALEFDGTYSVAADAPLSPADGPFSVLAWIRGGAPGQVVMSQIEGENWLGADPTRGFLMTELRGAGRNGCTLCSETVITDGDWHRIGLAWDGINRSLYVDDTVVAVDTQSGWLRDCSGALNIGCGKEMTQAFWSGLIDDVRIYGRAVRPRLRTDHIWTTSIRRTPQ
ncbi:MAG: hypothetical protein JW955_01050 [Sedimentisphaerales bacterium]|nr:hypothetical protein [Sedimentisphaerales bacterium]